MGFGVPVTGATLINSGVKNVDYLIIGSRLSLSDLGFYFRAFELGVDYQRKATVALAAHRPAHVLAREQYATLNEARRA